MCNCSLESQIRIAMPSRIALNAKESTAAQPPLLVTTRSWDLDSFDRIIGVEAVGALSDLTGIWPAVKHDIPGVSTVSDDNTRSWHGRTVRLNAGQAIPPDSHCDGLA